MTYQNINKCTSSSAILYDVESSSAKVDEDDGQTKGSYDRIVAAIYCNKITLNNELLTNKHATINQRYCNVSEFANESWAKTYGC